MVKHRSVAAVVGAPHDAFEGLRDRLVKGVATETLLHVELERRARGACVGARFSHPRELHPHVVLYLCMSACPAAECNAGQDARAPPHDDQW
jgi:hypothetical protein